MRNLGNSLRTATLFLAPIVPALLPILVPGTESRCAYVFIVMCLYWISEAVPLPATALIPVFGFPLLGVLSTSEVCITYLKDTNMLFLGGLIVAVSVEHSNLHKRIGLFVLLHIGQTPKLLLLSFMFTQVFLSMWISNTAATAMMVPITEAILLEFEKDDSTTDQTTAHEMAMAEIDSTVIAKQDIDDCLNSSGKSVEEENQQQDRTDVASRRQHATEDLSVDHPVNKNSTLKDHPVNKNSTLKDISYLGLAYAANIGGTGTLTGTNPNLVLAGFLEIWYPSGTGLNYGSWMGYNVPGMLLCVIFGYLWLAFILHRDGTSKYSNPAHTEAIRQLIQRKYNDLGALSYHEKTVITLFSILVGLWIFQAPEFIPGWGTIIETFFGRKARISAATPAMFIVLFLFAMPSTNPFKKSPPGSVRKYEGCLTWEAVHKNVPWSVIILIGSGFAMAEAAQKSGLAMWMAQQFSHLGTFSKEWILVIACVFSTMLTEVMSNTAAASILLPVLNNLALALKVHPLYFMLPVALCCSYAFMLPVATPPNAIVYDAAKYMPLMRMMKAGFVMNIICVAFCVLMANTYGVALFGFDEFPDWANATIS